jgi:hypothetical protein
VLTPDTQPSTCVPSKAPAFPLKSDFAFRSDSCNSRHWYFRVWFGYLPSEILVELLTRKVKHFHSLSKLTYRTKDQAENIRKRMGKNLYQESSNFIPIPRAKKYNKIILYYGRNNFFFFFFCRFILDSTISTSESSSLFLDNLSIYHP